MLLIFLASRNDTHHLQCFGDQLWAKEVLSYTKCFKHKDEVASSNGTLQNTSNKLGIQQDYANAWHAICPWNQHITTLRPNGNRMFRSFWSPPVEPLWFNFPTWKKHRIAGQMQETCAEHGDSKFQNETEIQNDPSRLKQMHRLSSSEWQRYCKACQLQCQPTPAMFATPLHSDCTALLGNAHPRKPKNS